MITTWRRGGEACFEEVWNGNHVEERCVSKRFVMITMWRRGVFLRGLEW